MIFSLLVEYDSVTGYEVPRISIPESLLYALIGFAVTFLGIALLIFFVWGCGVLIKKTNGLATVRDGLSKIKPSRRKKQAQAEETPVLPAATEEGVSEEVRVAIIAAIAAYYSSENSSCEFKVKRIKRI